MNGSERNSGAVIFERGVLEAERREQFARDEFSRRLMREHLLTTDDLIYPVFVIDGKRRTQRIAAMPGILRYTVDRLLPHAEQCMKLGIPALAIFPALERGLKTADGREATNPKGLVPRTIAALKKNFPEGMLSAKLN